MTAPITSNGPITTRLHHYAGRYSVRQLRGVGEGLCLLAFIKIETTSRVVPRAGDFDRSRCWV